MLSPKRCHFCGSPATTTRYENSVSGALCTGSLRMLCSAHALEWDRRGTNAVRPKCRHGEDEAMCVKCAMEDES